MLITRENYEVYLIDYFEGNLDNEDVEQVEAFLELNPDLAEEAKAINEISIGADKIDINKEDLFRSENDVRLPQGINNMNHFLLARLEGDLNSDQEKAFDEFVKILPNMSREYELLQKAKLQPDMNIVYPDKKGLKKKKILALPMIRLVSSISVAAAMIVVFIGVMKKPAPHQVANDVAGIYMSQLPFEHKNESEGIRLRSTHKSLQTAGLVSIGSGKKLYSQESRSAEKPVATKDDIIDPQKNSHSKTRIKHQSESLSKSTIESPIASNVWIEIDENRKPVVAQLPVSNRNTFIQQQIRQNVLSEDKEEAAKRKFTAWDIADAGLRGLGKVLNRDDMKLHKEYDENGQLKALAYDGRLITFNAPVNSTK